jgi:hypothetical protein
MSEDATPPVLDGRTEEAIAKFHRGLAGRLKGVLPRKAAAYTRSGLRVLVTGGRSFDDFEMVRAAIEKLPLGTLVIHGGARGADTLAAGAASNRGLKTLAYRADWRRGKRAGPERNQRMLDDGQPHFVLAFPGAAGTGDCVTRARRAGIPVVEVAKLPLGAHVVPEGLR